MANRVGIDELHYDCLPEKKMNVINFYQDIRNDPVVMIDDGDNDASSLKKHMLKWVWVVLVVI